MGHVRKTSIEAYNAIKDQDLLSQKRWLIYDVLFRKGPLTANEVIHELEYELGRKVPQNSYWPRLMEMVKMEVIYEVGIRECRITNRNVLYYDVTDKLPIKLKKPEKYSTKITVDKLKDAIANLVENDLLTKAQAMKIAPVMKKFIFNYARGGENGN